MDVRTIFKHMWKTFKHVLFLKHAFKHKLSLGQNTARPLFLNAFFAKHEQTLVLQQTTRRPEKEKEKEKEKEEKKRQRHA